MQDFYRYIPLVAVVIDLLVGGYIVSRDWRIRANRLFFFVAVALAVWGVGEFIMRSTSSPQTALLAGRIGSIGWCLVGPLFLHLSLELSHWNRSRRRLAVVMSLYTVGAALILLTWLTPLVLKGYTVGSNGGFQEITGALRMPSKIFVVATFVAGIAVLWRFRRADSTSNEDRIRTGYVIIAALIPLAIGLVTDVIMPLAGKQAPISSQAGGPLMAIIIAVGVTSQGLMTSVAGTLGVTVISNMKDAVLVTGPDGTIETVNPAAQVMTGFSQPELVDRNINTIFVEGIGESTFAPDGASRLASPRIVLCERKDGETLPVSRSDGTISTKSGKVIGYVTVLQDMQDALRLMEAENRVVLVSAEVKAEQERREFLRKSSEELRKLSTFLESVLENLAEPVWIKDSELRYLYINKAFTALTGYEREQIAGLRDSDCYWKDYSRSFREKERGAMTSGQEFVDDDFHFTDSEGVSRVARWFCSPIENDEGDVDFLVGTLSDLTEQKQLESARLDFIRIAAHELRAPLTSLRLGLELLARLTRGALNSEQQRSLDILSLSIERLSRLSKNLLDLASMDAGLVTLHLQEVEVSMLFNEAEAMFSSALAEKGLVMHLDVPDDLRRALADPSRMSQVLYNLVSNAVKYTDRGSITMAARDTGDGRLEISVTDTGAGIPASARDAIFSRFVKAQSAETAREGTGLGLSITKAIVEAHGGTISVESRLGAGSTFRFTIPAADHAEAPAG